MNVLTADEMRAADAHAINDLGVPSLVLMENAAARVAQTIVRGYAVPRRTLVLCGTGNNGGDGLAVARLLKDTGWDTTAFLLGRVQELRADPLENWKRAQSSNVICIEDPEAVRLEEFLSECELVIDGLFGTGLSRPLQGVHSATVQKINHSGKKVVSIDVPSGLNSDSGALTGPAIKAQETVALAALKRCHVLSPASKMCGTLYVVDIGIPATSTTVVVRSRDVYRLLPHRPVDGHKGTFGHAVVIGGSPGKSGAPYLSGKSALRCGAGLVTIACPSAIQPVVASYGPEIMTLSIEEEAGLLEFLTDKTVVAIGPGFGTGEEANTQLHSVLSNFGGPLVVDADGLNLVAQDLPVLGKRKKSSTILTPHPGEMSRLLQTDTRAVQNDRIGAARTLASKTGAIVVLKGYRTIVAHSDGNAWIIPTGGQALASGGTGDVLTGLITGFLAQKLKPVEAAIAGVYLHGLTSNLFEAKYPQQAMNASDIMNWWNEAVHQVRSGKDIEGEYLQIHFTF